MSAAADRLAENILNQLRNMPHVARRAVLADLATIALGIPDLYPLAIAAANEGERSSYLTTQRHDIGFHCSHPRTIRSYAAPLSLLALARRGFLFARSASA